MPLLPVHISQARWNGIVQRSTSAPQNGGRCDRTQEDRYREYVRLESQEMTRKWERAEKKTLRPPFESRPDPVNENDEYLGQLRQQPKKSPTQLKSAALLADVMQVNQEQRRKNVLQSVQNRQALLQHGNEVCVQNKHWFQAQQQRELESRQRALAHKQDLQAMIAENREKKRRQCQSGTNPNVWAMMQQQQIAARKKLEMEKRQEQLRRTATEAMRMAEERRMRVRAQDKITAAVAALSIEGQSKLQELKIQKATQLEADKFERQERAQAEIAKILREKEEQQHTVDALVRGRAAREYSQQLQDREKAEVERKRMLKAQRIKYHLEQMEMQKEREQASGRIHCESISNRMNNAAITKDFFQAERDRHLLQSQSLQRERRQQWEERQRQSRAERDQVQEFTNRHCDHSREHQEFFDTARDVVATAKAESKPLTPFVRAVSEYQKEHFVEPKPVLPHLLTQVPICYQRDEPKVKPGITSYDVSFLKTLNPLGNASASE